MEERKGTTQEGNRMERKEEKLERGVAWPLGGIAKSQYDFPGYNGMESGQKRG